MTDNRPTAYTARMADESENGREPSGQTERERFEALAKKLLTVPKREIDRRRAQRSHVKPRSGS